METQVHGIHEMKTCSDDAVASYEQTLRDGLSLKREVVLDFTCLKACLDPQKEKSEGEEFNYEKFLCQELTKGVAFSSLEVLKVRNLAIPNPLTPETEDYYADLLHGVMQLSNLVDMDLSGNQIPEELQKHLTFWNMPRLKTLCLDGMGLTSLPPSVGRLRQLEVLSANNNRLSSLPVTLTFCQDLRELNLKNNQFTRVPGVVLHLPHLQDLRRLGNPLPQLFNGFEQPPHINISTPVSDRQTRAVFNPDSLQSLCAKTAFALKIDYWATGSVGPLQCRTLDCLASHFKLCEHCNSVVLPPREWKVEVMLLRYLDLRLVPVMLTTCSAECQSAVLQQFRQLQTQTQTDIDREYEESVRQAETLANRAAQDTGTSAGARHCSRAFARNTRRYKKHKCTIM